MFLSVKKLEVALSKRKYKKNVALKLLKTALRKCHDITVCLRSGEILALMIVLISN